VKNSLAKLSSIHSIHPEFTNKILQAELAGALIINIPQILAP